MDYMKEIIKQFVNSIPEQTKANTIAKLSFEKDNKALIEAFAKNRNTYDVLKDMSEKYEQLKS